MTGNTLLLSEVLDLVAKAKTKEKKIQTLREHNSDSLRMILKSSFDPDIEWLLPQGEVPFIPNDAPAGTEHNVLAYESRKLYHYIRGGNNTLSQNKRESMFVQLLEGLHESEADLLYLPAFLFCNKNIKDFLQMLSEKHLIWMIILW